ncbi:hypothetical protein QZH41_018134 [Actinostola sp. cb2023]|nr:hypothetical protein QZH41_018134 [Actinostola sp. cb2023]
MLTEKEKECFRDLLERIELRDLITLTDTVTNRVVSAENRQEAVEAVLLYSVNAVQLLRRKKVKREHLYHYLAEKGSIEPITADKPYLCRRILELWGSADSEIPYGDCNSMP